MRLFAVLRFKVRWFSFPVTFCLFECAIGLTHPSRRKIDIYELCVCVCMEEDTKPNEKKQKQKRNRCWLFNHAMSMTVAQLIKFVLFYCWFCNLCVLSVDDRLKKLRGSVSFMRHIEP